MLIDYNAQNAQDQRPQMSTPTKETKNEQTYKLLYDESDEQYLNLFFSCTICLEIDPDCFWTLHGCSEGRFCTSCYKTVLGNSIAANPLAIKCPVQGCTKILDEEKEIVAYLDPVMKEKYYADKLRAELLLDKNFIFCPIRDCGEPFSKREEDLFARCPKCRKNICFSCKEEMHNQIDCKEFRRLKLENDGNLRKTEEWKKLRTKDCPKCKYSIEKSTGCDHMTCSNCKYEFCWKCLEKYYDGHIREKHPVVRTAPARGSVALPVKSTTVLPPRVLPSRGSMALPYRPPNAASNPLPMPNPTRAFLPGSSLLMLATPQRPAIPVAYQQNTKRQKVS